MGDLVTIERAPEPAATAEQRSLILQMVLSLLLRQLRLNGALGPDDIAALLGQVESGVMSAAADNRGAFPNSSASMAAAGREVLGILRAVALLGA